MFDFLKRSDDSPAEVKASATGAVVAAMSGAGRVAWSPRDTVTLTRVGFTGNPVGFRTVKLIAEAAAALPLVLQNAEERFETHPLLALVNRPNTAQSRSELFEAIYAQILLSGNGYIEAVGDGESAMPTELHVLRSDRMSLVPGADGWPVAYECAVGGRKHRFHIEEGQSPVCHIKSFHPSDDHYGLPPIQAAATAIDVHNSASRWSKSLLDNAARPSGAIVYKGADGQASMSADQYDRLLCEMESHHQGARNAGRPMLLEGGLDWMPMGFSPSDMEFQKTKESSAREIALAFGVPPMLLGIQGDATYSNYQEANRAFYRLTVLPLVTKITSAVGHWLSEMTGEAVTHIAVTASPWPGSAAVFSSTTDAGYDLNTLVPTWSTIGTTETTLEPATSGLWDRGGPLRVKLVRGELASAETEAVLNGANAMAIGDGTSGNWEVFQFAKAELVGEDTYDLSMRLRGQGGTDGLGATWTAGSYVVLLNNALTQIEHAATARGLARHYRIGPSGRSYDDPSYKHRVEAFDGIGLRPYAPAHLRAEITGFGDYAVTWTRRTRIDGDSWQSLDVPLGESTETYVIRVIKDGSVLRETISVSSDWTYPGALQAVDGAVAPFSIDVAQLSESFGPGLYTRIDIND